MANGWTPERRARQAELIRTWKPWQQSTDPNTDAGKAASAGNATKHGARSRRHLDDMKLFRELIRRAKEV